MTAKRIVLLVYGLLVVVAFAIAVLRPASLPPIYAATALAPGQILSTGDVRLDGAPRYLRRPIKAGGAISEADLGDFPVELPAINVGKDSVPVIMTLATVSPRVIPGANSRLWICTPKTGQLALRKVPVKVQSVLCDESRGAVCVAIVDLPRAQAANVGDDATLSISECK